MNYDNTHGLIVRKTYPELLSNHIRMFFVEHPEVKRWFNKAEKTIYWPNGSTTEFSYLQHTDDVYTYQGREYEDISIDEITQHEEEVFKILRSSNRTTNKEISPTMFLTGNPGGIGHAWVKRIFVDENFTEHEEPRDFGFVQAKVQDNKALMDADPAYVKRLQDLPEDKRRAYLDGDWDIFAGQVFNEFRRNLHVLPPLIPRRDLLHYIWMDWGYADTSAYAVYLSAVKEEYTKDGQKFNRVITYKEFYGNQTTPKTLAQMIYAFCKENKIKPYMAYSDPSMHAKSQSGENSIAEMMMEEWKRLDKSYWTLIEKGSNTGKNSRINRVGMMHEWLSIAPDGLPYWMITDSCANFIRTVPMLVHDENVVEAYDTNQEDHCLHPDTAVITYSRGIRKIKDLVGTTGKVLSVGGRWIKYNNCKKTRLNAKTIKVIFEDGSSLVCTPDHKLLLSSGNVIEAGNSLNKSCYKLNISQIRFKNSKAKDIIDVESILEEKEGFFIGLFGKRIVALFLRIIIFIIEIIIGPITSLLILSACLNLFILQIIQKSKGFVHGRWLWLKRLKNGTDQRREENGTKNIILRWPIDFTLRFMIGNVYSVGVNIKHQLLGQSFVLTSVLLPTVEWKRLILLRKFAQFAKRILNRINMISSRLVQDRVPIDTETLKVVRIEKSKSVDTYCLTAEKYHVFAIASGVIVSNSADSCAYGLEKIQFIKAQAHGVGGYESRKPFMPYRMSKDKKKVEHVGLDLSKFADATMEEKEDWRRSI